MSIHEEAERRYPDCSDPRHKQHYNEVRIARAVFVEGAEWMQSERDEALAALGVSRQRFGDSETKRVELEAALAKAREISRSSSVPVGIPEGTHFRGLLLLVERTLAELPSVVLQDREREVAARAWDEAKERYNSENFPKGCVCFDGEHRRKYPAMHWLNPYRADQDGEQS